MTPDLRTCARNLKPCTTLSYMAMDSSIYSSPGHVAKSGTALRFGGIILTNPSNVIFRQEVTPDLGTCGRNLKPCTTLCFMAMDSSIYSSPGHVVQKVVQRFVLARWSFFFFETVKCDISSVGDPRFGNLWPEFLKPCTTLSYMAMDSSIYSSPGHVVQKVVQRFVLAG